MFHVYHGNNVGHPLYPQTAGQNLTYIMSSLSTSLEPKSQLTINLDPGWECQSLSSEENKKREQKKKTPNQRVRESKNTKERKFPIKDWKKTEEICWKVFRPDNIWIIQNCQQVNKQEKKGNHDVPKLSGPLGPSRIFQQKAVPSGRSKPARLGELGSNHLPLFPYK